MRRVRWNGDGRPRRHVVRLSANREFHVPFKDGEALVEVMTVMRRAGASRYVHIDQAIATAALLAADQDGVGIADAAERNMPRGRAIRVCHGYFARQIVGGKDAGGLG